MANIQEDEKIRVANAASRYYAYLDIQLLKDESITYKAHNLRVI